MIILTFYKAIIRQLIIFDDQSNEVWKPTLGTDFSQGGQKPSQYFQYLKVHELQ